MESGSQTLVCLRISEDACLKASLQGHQQKVSDSIDMAKIPRICTLKVPWVNPMRRRIE